MSGRNVFLAEVRRQLYPELFQQGFRGSGLTLRRVAGELIHVVSIQGGSSGEGSYVNLGAHLAFLPRGGLVHGEPARLTKYECAFRTRVNPEPHFHLAWPYGGSRAEAARNVSLLCEAFRARAPQFFSHFASYPASFSNVTPSSLETAPRPHFLASGSPLVWAQIALHLGNADTARAFAKIALTKCSPAASASRDACEQVLAAT